MSDNEPEIKFDNLAEKLVPDPRQHPDFVQFSGFLGRSAQDGYIRLYDDVTFRGYYEILVADIAHSQQLSPTQAPLGGSIVYVKQSARLRWVQVSPEIEARFLLGPMSAAVKRAAGVSSVLRSNRALLTRQSRQSVQACPSDAHTSCSDVCPGGTLGENCGGGGATDPPDCIQVYTLSFDYQC